MKLGRYREQQASRNLRPVSYVRLHESSVEIAGMKKKAERGIA